LWTPPLSTSNLAEHTPTISIMAAQGFPPPELKRAAEEVAALLRAKGETIAVAETAAGGLISASLLSTPGASKFYKGGLTVRGKKGECLPLLMDILALHLAVSHRIRRLDTTRHRPLQGSNTGDRSWSCGQREAEAGIDILRIRSKCPIVAEGCFMARWLTHCLKEWHRRALGRKHIKPYTASPSSGSGVSY
jgi:Competence-damaged protein